MYDDEQLREPPDGANDDAAEHHDDDGAYANLLLRAEREIERADPPQKQPEEIESPQWTPPPEVSDQRPAIEPVDTLPAEQPQVAAAHPPASDPLAVFGAAPAPPETIAPAPTPPRGAEPIGFPAHPPPAAEAPQPQAERPPGSEAIGVSAVDGWFAEFGQIDAAPPPSADTPIATGAAPPPDEPPLHVPEGVDAPQQEPLAFPPAEWPEFAAPPVRGETPRMPQATGAQQPTPQFPGDELRYSQVVHNHYRVSLDSEQLGEDVAEFVMEEFNHEWIGAIDVLGQQLQGPVLHSIENLRDGWRRAANHTESLYPRV